MDIIDILSLVSMKTALFMDTHIILSLVSMEMAFFMDKNKKETPPKGMSLYFALSREGRLKNRGRPWPREREGPNAVGRDLVFQP